MKFLHPVIFSVILVGYVTASAFSETELGKAIDASDFGTVRRLCEGHRLLCNEGIDYMVDTKDRDFIINFIKRSGMEDNGYTLLSLHRKKSKADFDEILKEVRGSERYLAYKIAQYELVCSPEDFLDLLAEVTDPKEQEWSLQLGFNEIIESHQDCIDPLLAALERRNFLNESLKAIAIEKVFVRKVSQKDNAWLETFCEHPAVTPELYVKGLLKSGSSDNLSDTFHLLLAAADQQDLLTLIESDNFVNMGPNFHAAVKQAMSVVKSGENRYNRPIERAKLVRKTFAELGHPGVPSPVAGIISSYLTGQEPEKTTKGEKTVAQKQGEQAKVEVGGEKVGRGGGKGRGKKIKRGGKGKGKKGKRSGKKEKEVEVVETVE